SLTARPICVVPPTSIQRIRGVGDVTIKFSTFKSPNTQPVSCNFCKSPNNCNINTPTHSYPRLFRNALIDSPCTYSITHKYYVLPLGLIQSSVSCKSGPRPFSCTCLSLVRTLISVVMDGVLSLIFKAASCPLRTHK